EHEILVDGKSYKVKLETCSVGVPFSVRVNEKDVEVKIEGAPDYKAPFTVTIQGKPYRVELKRIDRRTPFPIKVNGIPFNVQFKTAERKAARILTPSVTALAPKPSRKIAEEGEILAPMAGKIVSVKVKKGDKVKLGDVLCTLEAMKMENEITATKSGVIEEVNVSEGSAVNEGDVLMKIK
ncbi:MAG: biotin/lipoyl-containing protein, partial [Candidatus Bathyarchaeia archaeon]